MPFTRSADSPAIDIFVLDSDGLKSWLAEATELQRAWVASSGFKAAGGKHLQVPGDDGAASAVLVGRATDGWLYQLAGLPRTLPVGNYRVADHPGDSELEAMAIGWGLACYRFTRYRRDDAELPALVVEDHVAERAGAIVEAQGLVRDLINTPTEDMGPMHLEAEVRAQAAQFGGDVSVITGDALLEENYPSIHAVGRAAAEGREPRLIRLDWGDGDAPLLALVGKGVCFDTGGLDLKPAAGMLLMKKDMGGAAHVLALARLVMQQQLPVRLLMLIPAVENAVSGNAYRPGDVLATRKGLTVEIGNTDAEGRVVLSDALALACEEMPDLIVDMATLTGAARVAMGADVPPVFSNDLDLGRELESLSMDVEDPLWTLPLWQGYRNQLKSPIADLNNISKGAFGGCITAALFLEHFVDSEVPWIHIDTFGWNQVDRPGRPRGGEALGMRAVWAWLEKRYAD